MIANSLLLTFGLLTFGGFMFASGYRLAGKIGGQATNLENRGQATILDRIGRLSRNIRMTPSIRVEHPPALPRNGARESAGAHPRNDSNRFFLKTVPEAGFPPRCGRDSGARNSGFRQGFHGSPSAGN